MEVKTFYSGFSETKTCDEVKVTIPGVGISFHVFFFDGEEVAIVRYVEGSDLLGECVWSEIVASDTLAPTPTEEDA